MRTEFIEEFPLCELKPADYNPRKLEEDKFILLQESLDQFGVIKPVIVNGDNGILTAGLHPARPASQANPSEVSSGLGAGCLSRTQPTYSRHESHWHDSLPRHPH